MPIEVFCFWIVMRKIMHIKLGCRERKTYKELEMDGKILALLDGQQRVTVLTKHFLMLFLIWQRSQATL